jgi:hypothetical protein
MNALALFLSRFVTLLLSNLEKHTFTKTMDEKISLELLKNDWKIVIKLVIGIFILCSSIFYLVV